MKNEILRIARIHKSLNDRYYDAKTKESEKAKIRGLAKTIEEEAEARGEVFCYLVRMQEQSIDRENKYLDITDFRFYYDEEEKVEEVISRLKANGYSYITVSESSTALMKILWALTQKGCLVKGMTEVNTYRKFYTEEFDREPAMLIKL